MREAEMVTTSRTMLEEARRALAVAGVDTARLDAEVLLARACGIPRAMLLAGTPQIGPDVIKRFRRMVARRAAHEPLAYIIGRKEFFSLDFEVTPAVLIPRPDTETLVEAALKFLATPGHPRVLDIGTGSGAIAVALAMNALDASRPIFPKMPLKSRATTRCAIDARIASSSFAPTFFQTESRASISSCPILLISPMPNSTRFSPRFAFTSPASRWPPVPRASTSIAASHPNVVRA
jgi:hypothetical protein